MKIIKFIASTAVGVLGVCIIIFAIQAAGLFAVFSQGNALHQKRIQHATEGMAAYPYEDWQALYMECTGIVQEIETIEYCH